MTDTQAVKVAAFLVQALEMELDPIALADDVVPFKRDVNAGISSVQIDSSIGPIPFLIYDYQLLIQNAERITGQSLFEADLRTLERAAVGETPGPRVLAHATAGDEAFILAATPGVHRALTGIDPNGVVAPVTPETRSPSELAAARADAANELLRIVRDGNAAAQRWLELIQQDGADESDDFLEFNQAEAALALYVLDERSIQHLLRVLSLLVQSAKGATPGPLLGE
jgi:hypothetical protein